jgi:dihydroorotate dehydrogenase (fumarate)
MKMGNLKTTYMGLKLNNPIIVGASTFTSNLESIKRIEEAGAGAVVISSLFEEQVKLESFLLEEDLHRFDNLNSEMITFFPEAKHAGPDEHLMWVRKAKESVSIPVIASLNAVNRPTWVQYAELLAETNVDGLELNFYTSPTSFDASASDVEDEQLETLKEIKANVSIPISVKLSPFYSNPLHFIKRVDEVGVNGFVLFNRFFQPDIDVGGEKHVIHHNLSTENDNRLPLRFAGLLFGNVFGDICSNSGIMTGQDAIKLILAGASCVQVVSTLYRNKISYLPVMIKEMEDWMDDKGYQNVDEVKGKLSSKENPDPWVYKRAQYVRLLLQPDLFLKSSI